MDSYLEIAKKESLCGIAAEHWLSFFKIFQEQRDEESINAELNRLRTLESFALNSCISYLPICLQLKEKHARKSRSRSNI